MQKFQGGSADDFAETETDYSSGHHQSGDCPADPQFPVIAKFHDIPMQTAGNDAEQNRKKSPAGLDDIAENRAQ